MPHSPRSPRRGRTLELLVAKLEHIVQSPEMAKQDLEVLSPAYWVDPLTGEPREVDISIGPKGAPPGDCIMVECRDRNSRQDSTWLEQVDGKRRSLSPKHVIVVSRRGFTKPARKKAAHWGIEIRLFEELTPEMLSTWLHPDGEFTVNCRCSIVDDLAVDLIKAGEHLKALGQANEDGRYTLDVASALFMNSQGGTFTTKELVYKVPDDVMRELVAQLKPGGGSKSWRMRLLVTPDEPVTMRTNAGEFGVSQIRFKLILWMVQNKVPPSELTSYVTQDGEKLQMVSFHDTSAPSQLKITMARASTPNADGSHNVYLLYDRKPAPDTMTPPPPELDAAEAE